MKLAVSTLLVAALLLVSCQSAPPPIAPDSTAEIYFQRAQAASDLSQYDEALSIYQAFLTNRTDATREELYSARYEVALLQWKKGLVSEAIAGFEAILADYEDLDKSAGAPNWVKVLVVKKLQEIKDKASKAKS